MIPSTSGKLLLLLFGVAVVVALVHAQQQQQPAAAANTKSEPKKEDAHVKTASNGQKPGYLPVPPGVEAEQQKKSSDEKPKMTDEKEAKNNQKQPKTPPKAAAADNSNDKTEGERVEMVQLGEPTFKVSGEDGDHSMPDVAHLSYKEGGHSENLPDPAAEEEGEENGSGEDNAKTSPDKSSETSTTPKAAAALLPLVNVGLMLLAVQLVI